MENVSKIPATEESVWAAFRETDRMFNESEARFEREKAASRADREKRMKNKKAQIFRINFPEYKNHRVYLALSAMIFNQRLEQECIKKGIAVVKQVGNTVVINDKHMNIF